MEFVPHVSAERTSFFSSHFFFSAINETRGILNSVLFVHTEYAQDSGQLGNKSGGKQQKPHCYIEFS